MPEFECSLTHLSKGPYSQISVVPSDYPFQPQLNCQYRALGDARDRAPPTLHGGLVPPPSEWGGWKAYERVPSGRATRSDRRCSRYSRATRAASSMAALNKATTATTWPVDQRRSAQLSRRCGRHAIHLMPHKNGIHFFLRALNAS